MSKSNRARMLLLLTCFALIFSMAGLAYADTKPAQDPAPSFEEAGLAAMAAPALEQLPWSATPPTLTAEQQAHLNTWADQVNLPGPALSDASDTSSATLDNIFGTQSTVERPRSQAPLAPGSPLIYRNINFGGSIGAGLKSNVMESSVGVGGQYGWFTGNWFAARSTNGGANWVYSNPFSGYADFCCDQVTLYDESRNLLIWLRMASPTATGNTFKLSISNNGGASFWTYTTAPTNVNGGWTNRWFDYPNMQVGADYLYMTWNLFDTKGTAGTGDDTWDRSIILRWPLDSLAAAAGFGYNYYNTASWFTLVPAQGTNHTAYFASNWPSTAPTNNRLLIIRWNEDSGSLTLYGRTVTAWTSTGRGAAQCGSASGNWTARLDQRITSGARYEINALNLKYPGRKVIGWWWNVAQGGSFPQPYVEAAAFFEDTIALVPSWQGRPLIWSSTACFAYASAAANRRGDLGLVFNVGTSNAFNPNLAFAIADDFVNAPPGFALSWVRFSSTRPTDNKWGDYNTSRPYLPTQETWIGGAHYLPTASGVCCSAAAPVFFVYGRERDYQSWVRWWNK